MWIKLPDAGDVYKDWMYRLESDVLPFVWLIAIWIWHCLIQLNSIVQKHV